MSIQWTVWYSLTKTLRLSTCNFCGDRLWAQSKREHPSPFATVSVPVELIVGIALKTRTRVTLGVILELHNEIKTVANIGCVLKVAGCFGNHK
jgi:hypothetical protein